MLYRIYDNVRTMRFLKRLSIGGIFLLITLVTLLGAVGLILLAPRLLDISSLDKDEWSQLNALVSVAGFALTLGVGVSILLQISESNDSRNLDIYQDIYEKMMSPGQIKARRFIYQQLPTISDMQPEACEREIKRIVNEDVEARKNIKQVMNQIDYFGFLVEREWVTSNEVIGWLSPIVVKVWEKIGPIVEHERKARPEEPDYYLSAVHLAEKCQAWRDREYPDRKPISFGKSRL